MSFDSQAIRTLLTVAKRLDEKGILNAIEGNVSLRQGDLVYITPSGKNKAFLTEEQIAVLDINGKHLGGGTPSSEYRLHLQAYRIRPDIGGIVHTHPTYLTAHALWNRPVTSKAYPEMMVVFGSIEVVPYGRPGTEEIYRHLAPVLEKENVVLLANHGAMAVGESVMDAMNAMEAAESCARILWVAGEGKELPLAERQALLAQHEKRMGR